MFLDLADASVWLASRMAVGTGVGPNTAALHPPATNSGLDVLVPCSLCVDERSLESVRLRGKLASESEEMREPLESVRQAPLVAELFEHCDGALGVGDRLVIGPTGHHTHVRSMEQRVRLRPPISVAARQFAGLAKEAVGGGEPAHFV